MATCPYCGKEVGENERYCWHCENDISEIANEEQSPKCFIATAAFGTPLAKEIDVLRNFRDKKLNKNFIGAVFVRYYYKISPPIAKIISRNEFLRKIARAMIRPVVRFLLKNMKK